MIIIENKEEIVCCRQMPHVSITCCRNSACIREDRESASCQIRHLIFFVIIANVRKKRRKREKPSITRHRNVSRSPRIDHRDDASTRATNRASLFPYSPKVRNQVKNLDTLTL